MQNKLNKKAVVFSIFLLFIMVALAPAVNSFNITTPISKSQNYQNITYDVYFGLSSPPPKVASNQTDTSFNPGILEYNTTYYWQIIAWNDQGESAEGPIWSFTTETIGPSVETLYADPVGKNNATLHGKILEDGGEQCQICFRYRESGETNWTYSSDWHGSYYANDTFSEEIDGLNKTTVYEFQAGAKNSIGEGWGDIENFTTSANQQPVAIIVAPGSADKKTDITFDGSTSYDPDGYIVEYLWDFGDGETGNGSVVTHQYQVSGTYSVALQVEDDDGDTGSTVHQITINNNAPVAVISVDTQYIQPGGTVTFDGTGSSDPNGDSLTYEWTLGDGTVIGTDAIITYTFNTPGTYMVILTVTDDDPNNQMSDSVSIMIYVYSPPIADFTYSPQNPFVMDEIEFDGSSSYDPDGSIVNWTWDFDTGDYAYGEVVTYVYVSNGWYTVTLTVTDNDGLTDSHSEDIYVQGWFNHPAKNSYSGQKGRTIKGMVGSYPPKTPSNPYPEDGAVNVPIDVVLSWTGGEDNPPDTPIITGPTSGKAGTTYLYTFTINDDDGDSLYLWVDWDDGTQGPFTGPYDSGEVEIGHTWEEQETYTIKAKVKDVYGVESDWGYLDVTMPRNKILQNSFFLKLQERFSNALPILRNIFGLYVQ